MNGNEEGNIKENFSTNAQRKQRIIIAGGGTGGHIFPAIAIANALKKINAENEILFVGAKGKMEMEKVPLAGYKIEGLDIAGFNRSSLIKNIGLPYKLAKSFLQVRRIFNGFKPNAVVGVGGYSSFPVLRYAQLIGIPTFIHEANSFAGKSNILLGKKAKKVFVARDGMSKFFTASKIVVTGNPIRPGIANVSYLSKKEALDHFGLKEGKKTMLAVGGSLGAKSINEAIATNLDEIKKYDMQLIWQTGKTEAAKWKEYAKGKPNIWVSDFITQMEYAYAAADIVISRAGAMTVAELCVVEKPVVFVPYPFAAEDHQTVNAKNLVQKGAACMVNDNEAIEKAVPLIIEIMQDEQQQQHFKHNISQYAIINADEHIAKEILESIQRS
jgi:UDP-N-acetylglucosamine--N-acetylmuramyl-(pentapeptide) pyrophosphoryl-undecaprenol N-acetylglucosamine transferase